MHSFTQQFIYILLIITLYNNNNNIYSNINDQVKKYNLLYKESIDLLLNTYVKKYALNKLNKDLINKSINNIISQIDKNAFIEYKNKHNNNEDLSSKINIKNIFGISEMLYIHYKNRMVITRTIEDSILWNHKIFSAYEIESINNTKLASILKSIKDIKIDKDNSNFIKEIDSIKLEDYKKCIKYISNIKYCNSLYVNQRSQKLLDNYFSKLIKKNDFKKLYLTLKNINSSKSITLNLSKSDLLIHNNMNNDISYSNIDIPEMKLLFIKILNANKNTTKKLSNLIENYSNNKKSSKIIIDISSSNIPINIGIKISDLFIKKGHIITLSPSYKLKIPNLDIKKKIYNASSNILIKNLSKIKLYIIMSNNTSMGGEVIASALKSHKNIKLVGSHSKKNCFINKKIKLSKLINIKDNNILNFTISECVDKKGINLDINGVAPNVKSTYLKKNYYTKVMIYSKIINIKNLISNNLTKLLDINKASILKSNNTLVDKFSYNIPLYKKDKAYSININYINKVLKLYLNFNLQSLLYNKKIRYIANEYKLFSYINSIFTIQ